MNNNDMNGKLQFRQTAIMGSAFSDEDISVLLSLKKIHDNLTDINEKRTIKRLIDKRPIPFLLDPNLKLSEKQLGYGRHYINKIFNKKISLIMPFVDEMDFYEREEYYISYYKKKHWLLNNSEYIKLTYIRTQFLLKKENSFKKSGLELLNIYTEEQIELIIKNHYKL